MGQQTEASAQLILGRYFYRPRSGPFREWWTCLHLPGCFNTRDGHTALAHRWNAERRHGMTWRWEEIKPGEIGYRKL